MRPLVGAILMIPLTAASAAGRPGVLSSPTSGLCALALAAAGAADSPQPIARLTLGTPLSGRVSAW